MTSALDEAKAVRTGEELDVPAVDAWIKAQVPSLEGTPQVTQYAGGVSNWTYRLQYANRDLILRRPPAGSHPGRSADGPRQHPRLLGARR